MLLSCIVLFFEIYATEDIIYLRSEGLYAVIAYTVVSPALHLFLRHLCCEPFTCLLLCDAIALHDAPYANLFGGYDNHHTIHIVLQIGFIENGALHPLQARRHKVLHHCGVYDAVESQLIGL